MVIQKLITALLVLFFSMPSYGYNESLVHTMMKKHLSTNFLHRTELTDEITRALEQFKTTNNLDILLASPDIKNICVTIVDTHTDESMKHSIPIVQHIILLMIYEKICKNYISLAEKLLNDLLTAKKYWMYEDFYMKQSVFSKNIVYNFYSSEYQNTIIKKLSVLHQVEDKVAEILGFCLYGLSNIEKIKDEDTIVQQLTVIGNQFFAIFKALEFNGQEKSKSILLYDYALCINQNLQQRMNYSQEQMKQNDKTSFMVDHGIGISCAIVAAITTAVMYAKHKPTIDAWYEQGKIASSNFSQEYVINPLVGLKEVIWDQKTKELHHMEPLANMPKIKDIPQSDDIPEYDAFSSLGISSILNPLIRFINKTTNNWVKTLNAWKDDTVKTVNEWKDSSEKTVNTKIDEVNNTIIKSNQINMYLATVGPVLFGAYWLGSSAVNTYGYYGKHANWHVPMKHIIRSLDQLINKVARSSSGHNFEDDGKLYMLIQHLKGYIVALPSEELFLMHDDIDELLSFDLNYSQKKGVIDRMYKTYEFLK